jgi:hypothetical protein
MRTPTLVLLVLTSGIIGCGSSGTAPSTTTTTVPTEIRPAVFSDPNSTFSTSEVRDVQDQIVRFDTVTNSLIWIDGRAFAGYPVSGNFVRQDHGFQVRFGTKNGERRAYFTETTSATICDIEVTGGQLVISATNVPVPEN